MPAFFCRHHEKLKNTLIVLILALTLTGGILYFSQVIIHSRIAIQKNLSNDLTTVVKQVANEVELKIQSKYEMMKALGNSKVIQSKTAFLDEKQDQIDPIGRANQ